MSTLYHDYETYCDLDIKEVGLYRYCAHPSLEILMMSWAVDDGPVQQWVPAEGEPMPYDLWALMNNQNSGLLALDMLSSPLVELRAFNAQFERLVTHHALAQHIVADLTRYRCTMAEAYGLAFTGGLAEVGEQLGLPDNLIKMPGGKQLINRFCKPAPKNHKTRRYTKDTHPDEWEKFKEYNRQDIEAERAIHRRIAPYQALDRANEWPVWHLDQRINDRGLAIDIQLCEAALDLHAAAKELCLAEMRVLTGLDNPNSGPQLKGWLATQGVTVPDLTAGTVDAMIEQGAQWTPQRVLDVLALKRKVGMTAPTKWAAYLNRVSDDGRLRGTYSYGGASRTLRWASRGINLQNLKRPPNGVDLNVAAELIKHRSVDLIKMLYGDPIEFLAYTVRTGICAPDGKLLNVADLSSIESRVVGWLADCFAILDTFARGLDTYKVMATKVFGCEYADVTKAQRTFSKPVVLAGPYGQGAKGLVEYAAGMGVTLTEEEAKRHVTAFRSMCPEIPKMWKWLDQALADAVINGNRHQGYKVQIYVEGEFLFIELPSGRRLAYFDPRIEMRETPWGELKPQFTYMGQEQKTRQWVRLSAHAGMTTENIVQAIARDILVNGLQLSDAQGLEICGHVHDEEVEEVTIGSAEQSLSLLESCMCVTPQWAPGLNLGADGFTTKHYRKD